MRLLAELPFRERTAPGKSDSGRAADYQQPRASGIAAASSTTGSSGGSTAGDIIEV